MPEKPMGDRIGEMMVQGLHSISDAITKVDDSDDEKEALDAPPAGTEAAAQGDDLGALGEILISWRDEEPFFSEPSFALLHLTLDHGGNLCYGGDDIRSETVCRMRGERVLRCGYDAACALLSHNEESVPTKIERAYCARLESDLTRADSYLRRLRRKEYDADILDRLESHFEAASLRSTISSALRKEAEDKYYRMDPFGAYAKKLRCDEWDSTAGATGLVKLLAQAAGAVCYTYDLSDAWAEIDGDITAKVDSYGKHGPALAQRRLIKEHIEPALCLLEELSALHVKTA